LNNQHTLCAFSVQSVFFLNLQQNTGAILNYHKGDLTMTPERMKELLNQIVDWVAIAENTSEQIKMLIQMGFTTDELIHEFHYSANDIQEWLNHQDDTE
jgi:hypothetical protein